MSEAQTIKNIWLLHRVVGNEIVDMLSDEHLDFRPWDGAMTLKELVLHTVIGTHKFAEAVQLGTTVSSTVEKEVNTAEELKQLVHEVTEKTTEVLDGLTDEKLSALVDATRLVGTYMPGKSLLHTMRDHEIHHKGQLYVYIRMIGFEQVPPFMKLRL
ncbi:DinB family protein [Metabacillus fastidiosus]|uniref:DinB family protein n=1 Tax=Metabacillus fastidiosus TaxID=1458 RepID=A0ABU6NXF3_9BACI|nr:DinB family protein [Metabacillus fastidiosus]MED4452871.1 DinB family protein [Metabacillus fastidiosus]MED4532545.1 DinB family protein [Metabacillus fastidiosus]